MYLFSKIINILNLCGFNWADAKIKQFFSLNQQQLKNKAKESWETNKHNLTLEGGKSLLDNKCTWTVLGFEPVNTFRLSVGKRMLIQ